MALCSSQIVGTNPDGTSQVITYSADPSSLCSSYQLISSSANVTSEQMGQLIAAILALLALAFAFRAIKKLMFPQL